MKLDRNRPYGTVTGSEFGAVYEQDGRNFDANGNEIGPKAVIEASDQATAMSTATLHLPKKK